MADASDVETALANQIAAALYPLGTGDGSVTGAVYRIYRGWPANGALEADLAQHVWHVSVTGIAGTDPAVPQFPTEWLAASPVAPALAVAVSGDTVTFSGVAGVGQLAGILVNDDGFSYRTRPGDTPQSVATSLGALVASLFSVSVSGASLTVPVASRLVARTEADPDRMHRHGVSGRNFA